MHVLRVIGYSYPTDLYDAIIPQMSQTIALRHEIRKGHIGTEIKTKIDQYLFDGNQLDIDTLNLFFKALNDIGSDRGMALRHEYYVLAVNELHLIPEQETFNLLLKGVRLSNPPLFKFIPYFLREFDRFGVEYDDCTYNELLTLCAQYPTAANFEAAKSWFKGYLRTRVQGRNYNMLVLNSYLNVLVRRGEEQSARDFIEWLRARDLWNIRLEHTADKLGIRAPEQSRDQGMCARKS